MNDYYFEIDKKRIPNNIRIIITNLRYNKNIIYAEHKKAFDKLSKCPIQLPIPYTTEQQEYFYKKLKWLSSKAGYKASNEYDIDKWINDYPKNIKGE